MKCYSAAQPNIKWEFGDNGGRWDGVHEGEILSLGMVGGITSEAIILPSSKIDEIRKIYKDYRDNIPINVLRALIEDGLGGAAGQMIGEFIADAYYNDFFENLDCDDFVVFESRWWLDTAKAFNGEYPYNSSTDISTLANHYYTVKGWNVGRFYNY